jgi:predicted phosphodiesterase
VRQKLLERLADADRVVLLGDVVELRDRPLREALELSTPFFAELGEAMAGREVVLMPGNHDHHLLEPWLERRRLDGAAPPLGLAERFEPSEGAPRVIAERVRDAEVVLAYPGIRLRDDVFAMHGHYLDRHLTVPTFERLGVAAVERALGGDPAGPDPLDPAEADAAAIPDEYERAQAPVYALLFALAQATVGERRGGADPSARLWQMLSGGETRSAKVRGWLIGALAVPGAVGMANRLGLGPVAPDLSPKAIAKAGILAMGEVVERLEIEAAHVLFGHTHRRGPLGGEPGWTVGETSLWNTGSWVHTPSLLGTTAAVSPYWPGTVAIVGDDGPPEMRHTLDGLSRRELAGE